MRGANSPHRGQHSNFGTRQTGRQADRQTGRQVSSTDSWHVCAAASARRSCRFPWACGALHQSWPRYLWEAVWVSRGESFLRYHMQISYLIYMHINETNCSTVEFTQSRGYSLGRILVYNCVRGTSVLVGSSREFCVRCRSDKDGISFLFIYIRKGCQTPT